MNLAKNRKFRKYRIWRVFISNPREIATHRRKIINTLLMALKSNSITVDKFIKKRCKKIASFVLIEDRLKRKQNLLTILFLAVVTIAQLIICPIIVYHKCIETDANLILFILGFLGIIIGIPLVLIIIKLLFSTITGVENSADPIRFSNSIIISSILILAANYVLDLKLFAWILAGLFSNALASINIWILTPILSFFLEKIARKSSQKYPIEKVIYELAILVNQFNRKVQRGKPGNIAWRSKVGEHLENLAIIFEKQIITPLKFKNSEIKDTLAQRCKGIANHWRSLKTEVYFSKENTYWELLRTFNFSFVAMMDGHLGNLDVYQKPAEIRRSLRGLVIKVIPSLVLLSIWATIFFLFKEQIEPNVYYPLWIFMASLPISATMQYFNHEISKDYSLIGNFKTLINYDLTR